MKKFGLLAAIAAMFLGFASCEKVEPTALETSDLTASKLSGYVYYNKLDDTGAVEDVKVFEGKADVTRSRWWRWVLHCDVSKGVP